MIRFRRVAGRARTHVTAAALLAIAIAGCAGHRSAPGGTVVVTPVPEPVRVTPPVEVTTPPRTPPFQPSGGATSAELQYAVAQGKAVQREIAWVERERAVASGEAAAGEYLVDYLITPVDDYYYLEDSVAILPAHHTTVVAGSAHVAIVVRDAADGRMVQGLNVRASLESGNDEIVSSQLPFGWHPVLNRYGENMVLPRGAFTLIVHIARPTYSRHDNINGDRFTDDVTAKFENVTVSPDSLAGAAQRAAHGDGNVALALARKEGAAVALSLDKALREPGSKGYRRRSGDYNVTVIVKQASSFWDMQDGELVYSVPDSGVPTHHIDVSVRDAASGRFVPGLNVRATLLNSRKRETGTFIFPFMWHPWMNHYGLNVTAPAGGLYTIRVRADGPAFRRYGTGALKEFNRSIDVEVRNVRFTRAAK